MTDTICAYCFGAISGEPHVVRNRPYHPPTMAGGKAIADSGCYVKDKALVAAIYPPKVDKGQLVIGDDSDD